MGQTLASEIMADRTLCTGSTIKELDEEGIWKSHPYFFLPYFSSHSHIIEGYYFEA